MDNRVGSSIHWMLRGTIDDRLRASWRIVIALSLAFAGALGGGIVVQQLDLPELFIPLLAHFVAVVAVLCTVWILARYIDRRRIPEYGFNLSLGWGIDAIVGATVGIGLVGVAFALTSKRGIVTVVDVISTGTADSFAFGLLVVILGWVFVGFWEETLLRGLFLNNAAEGLTAWEASPVTAAFGAWLSSSLVYGFFHGPFGSNPETVSLLYALGMTAVMGGLFGLAYVLTDELALPIGLHTGINFAEHNLFFGPPDGVAPTVLRVEHAVSGGYIQFQSIDPRVIVPVFISGYVLITGWVYLRTGDVSIALDSASQPVE
jgi:membrane protease YdiL (CAAX protease family)